MVCRMMRGAHGRARLGLAACLFASLIPMIYPLKAATGVPNPACEPKGFVHSRPISLPNLKRALARGSEVRIVDFGPAFLKGLGDNNADAIYPDRLQALLRRALLHSRINVEIQGAAGETAANALAGISAELEGDPPAFAIWRTGADDALRKTPPAQFESSLREGIGRLRAASVDMEIVGLPAIVDRATDPHYADIAGTLARVAREQGVPFVDRATSLRTVVVAEGREGQLSDGGWTIDDFGGGCLAEQVARPIIEGVHATH